MKIIYFVFIIFLLGCNRNYNSESIESVLSFVVDSLSKQVDGMYSIDQYFTAELNEQYLIQDLSDYIFLDSLNYRMDALVEQHNNLTGNKIENYLEEKFQENIAIGNNIYESDVHFSLGVPLFNEDRSSFIQYMIFENYSDSTEGSWHHQYTIFVKNPKSWELYGIVKIERSELVNTID